LYNGDKETRVKSLEWIQRTTAEILEAIRDKEPRLKLQVESPVSLLPRRLVDSSLTTAKSVPPSYVAKKSATVTYEKLKVKH